MTTLFKVGSFVKDISLASPVAQAIPHGLGGTPVAAMFRMNGIIAFSTFTNHYRAGVGYVGGGSSYSLCASSEYAAATSNTSTRISNKAITIVAPGEVLQAEADFVSFDGTNINISWSTNDTTAYIINFAVWGGDIHTAKAITWSAPSSATELPVTGVGFNPDCLLASTSGTAAAIPSSQAWADFSFGAAAKGSGQWGIAARAEDAATTMNTGRSMNFGPVITANQSGSTSFILASIRSWDADGFTLMYNITTNGIKSIGLALQGGSYGSGLIPKTNDAATAVQQIARLPYPIRGGFIGTATASLDFPYNTTRAACTIGGFDGTNERVAAFGDDDNIADAIALSYGRNDKAVVFFNSSAGGTVSDIADSIIDDEEVSLSWTTNAATNSLLGFRVFGDKPYYPFDAIISGTCYLEAAPIENAQVWAMNQTTKHVFGPELTDVSGNYTLDVMSGALYHVFASYEDAPDEFNALSAWDVVPE